MDLTSAQVAQHLDVGREESDRLSPEKPKKERSAMKVCMTKCMTKAVKDWHVNGFICLIYY